MRWPRRPGHAQRGGGLPTLRLALAEPAGKPRRVALASVPGPRQVPGRVDNFPSTFQRSVLLPLCCRLEAELKLTPEEKKDLVAFMRQL